MEENKIATDNEVLTGQDKPSVRDRLAKASSTARYNGHVKTYISDDDYRIADAILQSPDLRIEIVLPKFYVNDSRVWERGPVAGDKWHGTFSTEVEARMYTDYLNSKEPK